MYKTIFKYFEDTVKKYPNKILFTDNKREISYSDFLNESKIIGSYLLNYNYYNRPIAIFLDKSIDLLKSMMGVNYSGNFYTVIDNKMPIERIENIFNVLNPVCIITDDKNKLKLTELKYDCEIISLNDIEEKVIDEKGLELVYKKIIDTNPMYILFTSGSTGVPKGAILSHKSVISYIHWFIDAFNITSRTVFGNQTPFYFSMSVSDVFSTMISGATLHIIPKIKFSFPTMLIDYLNEKKINTIYWVPSALCIVANFKTFDECLPKYLKKVLFAGEVMPMKQLNIWMNNLPNVMFANLFGPTETVDICSYYIVNRRFSDDEVLPIGCYCDNCDLFLIDENGNEITESGIAGELYVRGSFLTHGYYNNDEKTMEALVQNPLNDCYPELVYKTGDIVKYNNYNELVYVSRRDFQIKHMGYRIELGEIERSVGSHPNIENVVCIYNQDDDKIILYYKSDKLHNNEVLEVIKNKVPQYMVPQEVYKLDVIPYNANGKIDRKKLENDYKENR